MQLQLNNYINVNLKLKKSVKVFVKKMEKDQRVKAKLIFLILKLTTKIAFIIEERTDLYCELE